MNTELLKNIIGHQVQKSKDYLDQVLSTFKPSNIQFTNTNPTVSTNPTDLDIQIINTKTGEIFVCVNNTPDQNVWVGSNGTVIKSSTLGKFDFFNDGSTILSCRFDGNVYDDGGEYNGSPAAKEIYSVGKFGQAISSANSQQIKFNKPNQTSSNVTVSFWLKWNGNTSMMACSFGRYDLYFYGRYFGFNTFNSDLYGLPNPIIKGEYTHITAEFIEGSYGKIWINGKPQTLSQILRSIAPGNAKVIKNNFYVFGAKGTWGYRDVGLIDQLRMFNRSLTDAEVLELANEK